MALTPSSATASFIKSYACLTCRQRKVKCDRQAPCNNCVKAERDCSFVPPVRGKKRRTKPPKEGLHARLRRYEALLKSYGANIEPLEDDSASEPVSQHDFEMIDAVDAVDTQQQTPSDGSIVPDGRKPKLVIKEGTSRYFDSALWSALGHEFGNPEVAGHTLQEARCDAPIADIILGPPEGVDPSSTAIDSLATLHPSFRSVEGMWEIYLDRLDPLMKILHTPSFWSSLTDAYQHLHDLPPSLEAEMFGFYLATISAADDLQCQNIFGEQKSVVATRYRRAASQALKNAGVMSTSDPAVLRAYSMFIIGMRTLQSNDVTFTMSGIAVRLARRMGLHRDGTFFNLPPFETEMRRRLWWHVTHVDHRTADMVGCKPSADLFSTDTKMPLNVLDEDLRPDMIDPPPERSGITPIVCCRIRCELMELFRKSALPGVKDARWEVLARPDVPLAKKSALIAQLQDIWETKYLRYCDPVNPLHNSAMVMIRSTICKLKLFANNPREFIDRGVEVPPECRQVVMESATKLLEYSALDSFDRYIWHINSGYLWNTILYVLIEARHRRTGPEVARIWHLIGVVFKKYPQVFGVKAGAMYAALSKWTLGVWDDYVAATIAEGRMEPPAPEYIVALRESLLAPPRTAGSNEGDGAQSWGSEGNAFPDLESFDCFDFSDLPAFDMSAAEWMKWDVPQTGVS